MIESKIDQTYNGHILSSPQPGREDETFPEIDLKVNHQNNLVREDFNLGQSANMEESNDKTNDDNNRNN